MKQKTLLSTYDTMTKIKDLIPQSIQDTLGKVTSKPKRRRMKAGIIASTEEHRMELCKELRYYETKEKQDIKCIPVLLMFGEPRKRLTKLEVNEYTSLGCRVEYMTQNEVKQLKLK